MARPYLNRPWSKLQRELYKLISGIIDFQLHCVSYPMNSQYGSTNLPRYWITLGKETIWDYPKQFARPGGELRDYAGKIGYYPYKTAIDEISALIREYIDTPKEEILTRLFDGDRWGLINILRAADRRIGEWRLAALTKKTHNLAANKVIAARLCRKG